MGFKRAKALVLNALAQGNFQHEARNDIEIKNALLLGEISALELIEIIKSCNGTDHSSSPHHFAPSIEVHVLKRHGWYIKFYFIDPDTIFISVHR